jgi:hypothetical protein
LESGGGLPELEAELREADQQGRLMEALSPEKL